MVGLYPDGNWGLGRMLNQPLSELAGAISGLVLRRALM